MIHVALLRGINVGKAKRIAMADLRAVFVTLGFRDVRTLLNSGNVVFTFPGRAGKNLASTIEMAIAKQLGVTSRVTVLDAAELDTIVAKNPLLKVGTDHSRLMVSVLRTAEAVERVKPLLKRDWGADRLGTGERVAYMWCPNGILESELANALFKAVGDGVTTRNWATISRLHALIRAAST